MGTNGVTKTELDKALRETHDLFVDRCLLLNFLVLGDTAEGIRQGELYGDKIEVGVEKRYFTEELLRSLELNGIEKTEKGNYKFTVGEVPIFIKLIKKKYKFFENPDFAFYMGDTFYFGNPYEKYKRVSKLIR